MALKCAECGKDNPLGTFYCGRCAAGLIPEGMIPPAARRAAQSVGEGGAAAVTEAPPGDARVETILLPPPAAPRIHVEGSSPPEGEQRYRIILGDTCPVCRLVSRITFTPDRTPQIPISGCRERGGCRCSLPIFADELNAALSAPEPSLEALAPERLAGTPLNELTLTGPQPGLRVEPRDTPLAPAATEAAREAQPTPFGAGWSLPSPITQQRRRVLRELTDLYYQRRIQGIKIVTTPDCCRVCAEIGASIYEPSVAPTLPVVGCWDGWQCRCMYSEEALPLDQRGLQAMDRLQQLERDRDLRRRKVARGGPRPLHRAVAVIALSAAAGAALSWFDGSRTSIVGTILALVIAAACAVSAVGALRRWHRLPSPGLAYLLCGSVLAAIGFRSFVDMGSPGAGWLTNPSRLEQMRFSLHLGGSAMPAVGVGLQILAMAGIALLGLGFVTMVLAPSYERRVRAIRRAPR